MTFFLFYLILIPLLFNLSLEVIYCFKTAILWLCVLLSFISERLYQEDFEDGCLEYYFLSRWCLQCLFFVKLVRFWLKKSTDILVLFPIIQVLYHVPLSFCSVLMVGTLALSLVVAIYSCLTCGVHSWLSLQHLMILPSVLPILLVPSILPLICLVVFEMCVFWCFVGISIETLLSK